MGSHLESCWQYAYQTIQHPKPTMNFPNGTLILVLLLCMIHFGTCLKCYSYTGTSESEKGTEQTCASTFKTCQKSHETSTGAVGRTCQAAGNNGCTTVSTLTTCFCDTDLCNGSETMGMKPLVAITTTMLTIFVGKML